MENSHHVLLPKAQGVATTSPNLVIPKKKRISLSVNKDVVVIMPTFGLSQMSNCWVTMMSAQNKHDKEGKTFLSLASV